MVVAPGTPVRMISAAEAVRLKARRGITADVIWAAGIGCQRAGAAMIYQHQARGTDRTVTSVMDAHIEAERERDGAPMTPGVRDGRA